MAKNLLIVESPAKAKTIEGYLGKDFTVKSSYGHIRDLVKSEDAIDIANNFAQKYEVPADKKQVVTELKKLAKEADIVWLASDEDREGEAISWHLFDTLNLKDDSDNNYYGESYSFYVSAPTTLTVYTSCACTAPITMGHYSFNLRLEVL